jgi:hypothetical protein
VFCISNQNVQKRQFADNSNRALPRAGDLHGAKDFAHQEMDVIGHTAGPNHVMTAVSKVE